MCDDDSNVYCILVRDKSWRSSTFHFVFQGGCAYLDVHCNEEDGTCAKTTNSSFDGAGCLKLELDFPTDLANKLLHRVPKQKDSVNILKSDELAKEISVFYKSNEQNIPGTWRSDFKENEVY